MLHANRQQSVRLQREFLAFFVQSLDLDALGAGNGVVNARHGQAAFFVSGFAVFFNNDGVDEHARLAAVFGQIHHNHTLVHIDLRRRQPDTARFVHGFKHIGNQLLDALIDLPDRLRHGVQTLVGILQDIQ